MSLAAESAVEPLSLARPLYGRASYSSSFASTSSSSSSAAPAMRPLPPATSQAAALKSSSQQTSTVSHSHSQPNRDTVSSTPTPTLIAESDASASRVSSFAGAAVAPVAPTSAPEASDSPMMRARLRVPGRGRDGDGGDRVSDSSTSSTQSVQSLSTNSSGVSSMSTNSNGVGGLTPSTTQSQTQNQNGYSSHVTVSVTSSSGGGARTSSAGKQAAATGAIGVGVAGQRTDATDSANIGVGDHLDIDTLVSQLALFTDETSPSPRPSPDIKHRSIAPLSQSRQRGAAGNADMTATATSPAITPPPRSSSLRQSATTEQPQLQQIPARGGGGAAAVAAAEGRRGSLQGASPIQIQDTQSSTSSSTSATPSSLKQRQSSRLRGAGGGPRARPRGANHVSFASEVTVIHVHESEPSASASASASPFDQQSPSARAAAANRRSNSPPLGPSNLAQLHRAAASAAGQFLPASDIDGPFSLPSEISSVARFRGSAPAAAYNEFAADRGSQQQQLLQQQHWKETNLDVDDGGAEPEAAEPMEYAYSPEEQRAEREPNFRIMLEEENEGYEQLPHFDMAARLAARAVQMAHAGSLSGSSDERTPTPPPRPPPPAEATAVDGLLLSGLVEQQVSSPLVRPLAAFTRPLEALHLDEGDQWRSGDGTDGLPNMNMIMNMSNSMQHWHNVHNLAEMNGDHQHSSASASTIGDPMPSSGEAIDVPVAAPHPPVRSSQTPAQQQQPPPVPKTPPPVDDPVPAQQQSDRRELTPRLQLVGPKPNPPSSAVPARATVSAPPSRSSIASSSLVPEAQPRASAPAAPSPAAPISPSSSSACCEGCGEALRIGEPVLRALGHAWHSEHFACAHCSCTLGTGAFFERFGRAYCETCFRELFSPRCAFCLQPILDVWPNSILNRPYIHYHWLFSGHVFRLRPVGVCFYCSLVMICIQQLVY